jgi:hypothetical protein
VILLVRSPEAVATTPPDPPLPLMIVIIGVVLTPVVLGLISIGFNVSAISFEDRTTHSWAVVGFVGGTVTGLFAVPLLSDREARNFGYLVAASSLFEIALAAWATTTPLRVDRAPTLSLATPRDVTGALAPGLALSGAF